jgi:hypothetical protein
MKRFPVGWAILVFSVAMGIWGYNFYSPAEFGRLHSVAHVRSAPSRLYARLLVRYPKPPIFEEEYRMSDVEGVSTFDYRIRGFNGRQVTVTAPKAAVYDVSFFFGKLVQDKVWELVDLPPRPDPDAYYTVYVQQFADFKNGDRTVKFTNPQYWATTAGRQFAIDLSKQNANDLLKLQSTSLANPHYQAVVDDFRAFGPDEFRRNVENARARVLAGN